jgi:putative sterol carrier protein
MIDLDNLFKQMSQRFNTQAAKDIDAIFQYNLSGEQAFSCEIKDSKCTFLEGVHCSADIQLALNSQLLLDIVSGEADALQAFMEGNILAQGDVTLAPALVSLFPATKIADCQ